MADIKMKLLVIALLFLGESIGIYAEVAAAKSYTQSSGFYTIFFKMLLMIVIAAALLIAGYMLGVRTFKNIWVVSALSITSILIMEPIVDWVMFKQLPTIGAVVGLVFGALGFVATMVF